MTVSVCMYTASERERGYMEGVLREELVLEMPWGERMSTI